MKPQRSGLFRVMKMLAALLLLTYLYPLVYMIGRSVMLQDPGLSKHGISFTLDHYRLVLGDGGFTQYAWNSVAVLVVVVLANVVFGLSVAYAFARYTFPGRKLLFGAILVTLMIPKQVLIIPILDIMVRLCLHNTLWALILPFCVDGFNVFLLRQYIAALPTELEEAARTDGASEFQILRHVIFPLCGPAVAVVVINTSIITWNAFLFPLILTDSAHMRTLPVGLAMFSQGPFSTNWGALMAGASVSSLPLIVLFWIFQRQIIAGITSGALKD